MPEVTNNPGDDQGNSDRSSAVLYDCDEDGEVEISLHEHVMNSQIR